MALTRASIFLSFIISPSPAYFGPKPPIPQDKWIYIETLWVTASPWPLLSTLAQWVFHKSREPPANSSKVYFRQGCMNWPSPLWFMKTSQAGRMGYEERPGRSLCAIVLCRGQSSAVNASSLAAQLTRNSMNGCNGAPRHATGQPRRMTVAHIIRYTYLFPG